MNDTITYICKDNSNNEFEITVTYEEIYDFSQECISKEWDIIGQDGVHYATTEEQMAEID